MGKTGGGEKRSRGKKSEFAKTRGVENLGAKQKIKNGSEESEERGGIGTWSQAQSWEK